MKVDPLVSIVIPAYNEERYVKYCLKSLLDQTYKNIEIIVVDDGSTDGTQQIVKGLGIRVIHQNHKGLGAARNTGSRAAKGELIAYLDADIKYHPDYIKHLAKPILSGKAIGTFNKEEYVANSENIWSACWSINSDLPVGKRAPDVLPDELPVYRLIKKDAYERAGGFGSGEGYNDDATIAGKLGKNAIYAPGAIAYHFNPETLREVFLSSRWIGRSQQKNNNIGNFLRYSPINSLRNSVRKIVKGAPIRYAVFKMVYDAGMFSGIFLSFGKLSK